MENVGRSWLYRVFTYSETLEDCTLFPDNQPPDIIHAWTPREIVRKQWNALHQRFPSSKLIIDLEDNEEAILELHVKRSIYELRALPEEQLRRILSDCFSHPILYRDFLKQADGVTGIMDTLAEFVPAGTPYHVLWPIVDIDLFAFPGRDLSGREQLGIRPDEIVITYPSNVHAANAEDVRSLYLAVALANREGIPTRLVRAGEDFCNFLGHPDDWARQYAIECGFIPHQRVTELLKLADFFIQPGRQNSFNKYKLAAKIPEIMATGKPVVLPAANIGRFLKDREEAFLLQRGDALDMLDAIKTLHADKAMADRIALGSRAFAERHFTQDAVIRKLEQFYANIVQASRLTLL